MTPLLAGITLTIFTLTNYKIYKAKKKCSKNYQALVALLIVPHQQASQRVKITQESLTLQQLATKANDNDDKKYSVLTGTNPFVIIGSSDVKTIDINFR